MGDAPPAAMPDTTSEAALETTDVQATPDVQAVMDVQAEAPPESRAAAPVQDSLAIRATDLFKIQQLGSVSVSPDGRLVAYTAQAIEREPGDSLYAYRTRLFMVPAGGREAPTQLTRGENASDPDWHPDGDRIAFVRQVEGTPQIFVLPITGGEPYQLTRFEHGARRPRWSPDGTRLLFASTLSEADVRAGEIEKMPPWPDERPGRTSADTVGAEPDPDGSLADVRAWLAANRDDANPRLFTRLDLQGELDLEPRPSYGHFYVVDVEGDREPRPVTRGYFSFSDGEWLDEGRIVVSGAPDEGRHPDRVRERALYRFGVDGGPRETLLAMEGQALFSPKVSPDGRTVAFLASDAEDLGYAQTELGLYALDGAAEPELLTLGFDRSVGDPAWSPNGWYLYFVAPSDGGFPLYRLPAFGRPPGAPAARGPDPLRDEGLSAADFLAGLDRRLASSDTLAAADAARTSAPLLRTDSLEAADVAVVPPSPIERLTSYDRGIRSFDVSEATVFYVVTEPANPYELYANNLPFTQERRLTEHNAAWLAGRRLSFPEADTLRRDGLEIPYWVMRPAVDSLRGTYPLLLQIHGGPSAMWGPGEATMWHEFQFFAAQGYGVVYANPRGSGGYGYAFKRANYQDWGEGPAGDVLAAADRAATRPWVDPDRQVVTGGSYAGYLTAWIVGHDQRFQAAVAQRGVYDLATFLGEGNAWRLVPGHFGGYPWEAYTPDSSLTAGSVPPGSPDVRLDSALADVQADSADAVPAPTDVQADPSADATFDATDVQADTAFAMTDVRADTGVAEEGVPLGATVTPELTRALLLRNSPLTYVDSIRTPLLIMHSDNDLRTGVIQSEVLYKSLKILGRPVEYVRYPDAGHDLSRTGDPKQRLDRLLRIYEFVERYVGEEGDGDAPLTPSPPSR